MLTALAFAETETPRGAIREEVERIGAITSETVRRRERAILRDMRKRWSERFATACATMIANELRRQKAIRRRYEVLPDAEGGSQETFTPLGYRKGKRIDVVVFGPLVGLQIGVSLKGLNFADDASGNHDKNLTGRLYELRDEVGTVHDYLPRAFMAAVFFMPVAGCFDKPAAPSSFAHVVAELRARTGRLDPSVAAHGWRCDLSCVGLYAPGDPTDELQGIPRGVARYFPLEDPSGQENLPPRNLLPSVATTLDLEGLVDLCVESATRGTGTDVRYAPTEAEEEARDGLEDERALGEDEAYDMDEDEELEEDLLDVDD
jgi:hypothetical protein